MPVTRFETPPGYVVDAMIALAPERLEGFAAARGMSPNAAQNAFRVFFLPITQLLEETAATLEFVSSGWCYLQQGERGFEVVEVFEPGQTDAEWVRHGFGDTHPMAAAVAGTLAPSFSIDVDYELRLLLVPPVLPPVLWIVPVADGVQWFMAADANVEGMAPGSWYDAATFMNLLRNEVRRFNWDAQP